MWTFGGWGLVRVSGPSMVPTLRDGDGLLVRKVRRGLGGARAGRRGTVVRVGDVVVAEHPGRPGFLVVKRVGRRVDDQGWWLVSDNEFAGSDSREFGVVGDTGILGRAVLRFRDPAGVVRVRGLGIPARGE